MILKFFRRDPSAEVIDRLHGEIVAAVRQPALYLEYGVADTFEGRFELLVLFATAAVRRIERLPDDGPTLSQGLVDAVFSHLDIAMREMGVSDIAVPKRMKRLAGDFVGRSRVYGTALEAADEPALADAVSRNVFGGRLAPDAGEVVRLVRYMMALDRALGAAPDAAVRVGPLVFPEAHDVP